MPIYRRLPKRGFNNHFTTRYAIVSVGTIAALGLDEVSLEVLMERGVIKKPLGGLKVLGDGEIDRSVVVKANKFSRSAVAKIEAANGRAEVI